MDRNNSAPERDKHHMVASIVIPAYNEEKGIGAVLENVTSLDGRFEIIVVDDGSEDNTTTIVENYNNVRLIRHQQNMGYGAALKAGIQSASTDTVLIMDADGTYPHETIPDLIKAMQDGKYSMSGSQNREKY
jgi:glycosyltransferase involved in cell wall biosynthesis